MFAGCGEQVLAALQSPGKPSGMGNFCRVHDETIETCAFFRSVTTILPTKRPPFLGSKNGPQNGVHSFSLNLICLSGRLGPRFGVQKRTPKRGSCIPLGFHDFAAPRAILRRALQACMSAHALELGRPSVARPVFAVVFGPQTGAHENHFFSIP